MRFQYESVEKPVRMCFVEAHGHIIVWNSVSCAELRRYSQRARSDRSGRTIEETTGALGKIRIFLTSENHYRATDCWRRDCDAEVFALQPAGFNDVANPDAGARNFGGFEWRALDEPGGWWVAMSSPAVGWPLAEMPL